MCVIVIFARRTDKNLIITIQNAYYLQKASLN